jgi:ribokinase
VIWALP